MVEGGVPSTLTFCYELQKEIMSLFFCINTWEFMFCGSGSKQG